MVVLNFQAKYAEIKHLGSILCQMNVLSFLDVWIYKNYS